MSAITRKARLPLGLTLCLVVAAVAAISLAPAGNAATTKKPKIAHLVLLTNPYVKAIQNGIKDTSGGTLTTFQSQFNPQKLLTQCKDAIASKRYNVLIVQAADNASGVPCVKLAAKAKIPVLADSFAIGKSGDTLKPQVAGVVGTVASTPTTHAKVVLAAMKKACAGDSDCKVLFDQVNEFNPDAKAMIALIKKDAPNIDIVATYPSNYDPGAVSASFPPVLAAHPEAEVVFSADDVTGDVVARLSAGKNIKVWSDGLSGLGVAAIKANRITGTILQVPRTYGQKLGAMAKQTVNGQKVKPSSYNTEALAKGVIITKSNLGKYKPQY